MHDFDFNLGGVASPKDKRDFKLGQVQLPQPIPASYKPDISNLPIFYQKKQPSCSGHAGAWFKMYLKFLDEQNDLQVTAPRFLYDLCKRDDGIPDNEGTYLRQIFQELRITGVCQETLFPNLVDLPYEQYKDITQAPVTAFQDASNKKIKSFVAIDDLSFDGLKQAIYQNKAVIALVSLGNEWWTNSQGTTSWKKEDILPLRTPKNIVSGHFIVLYGYDENYIYFVNSWSKDWGDNGIGFFGKDYISFVREAGTAIDLPDYVIINLKQQVSLLTKVVAYLTQLLKSKK